VKGTPKIATLSPSQYRPGGSPPGLDEADSDRENEETPPMSSGSPFRSDGGKAATEDRGGRDPAEEFISHVAHELATPLSAMMLWINLLSNDEDLSPGLREGLGVIKQAAEEQQALIDALVDLSLISAKRLQLRLRMTNLGDVVQNAADFVRPQMEARQLVLQTDIGWDLGLLDVDAPRLQRVVLQLLSNAMKFTPRGGTVTLRARREPAAIMIQVADTGSGLTPEAIAGIFRRLEDTRRKQRGESGGLGLGLSIARNVVELHGGTITAESAGVGQGSTFTVRLPLRTE